MRTSRIKLDIDKVTTIEFYSLFSIFRYLSDYAKTPRQEEQLSDVIRSSGTVVYTEAITGT
jgi:hypothetical protein